MKKRKIIPSFIATALFCIMLVPLFAVFTGAKADDYSKPGADIKTVYNSADILSAVMKLELSDVERRYLEMHGEYSISYGSYIPTSFVSINYDEESREFAVIAKSYSYTAENGVSVVFTPASVTVADRTVTTVEFDTGSFLADFGVCEIDENAYADVLYTADFDISERILNSLVNKAYYDAVYWEKTIAAREAEYAERLSAYESELALYEEYLAAVCEYETALALYKAYRIEKRLYDEKLAEYIEYEAQLADYREKLDAYLEYEERLEQYNKDYLVYKKYLEDKKEYENNLELYNIYVENLKLVKEQLALIDGLKGTSTSLSRSVYNAIVGDTVTEVIANKDAIANNTVGVKPETVDMAGDATSNLRALFEAYFALESESEKYTYYAVNYEKFKTNFINLFSALDKMYENSKVRIALGEKGLKEKYEILLAQLFYVVNALSDKPVKNYDGTAYFDSTYKVNKVTGARPLEILGGIPYMNDNDRAEPLSGGYPAKVEPPVLAEVAEPEKPQQIARPIAPDEVLHPGEAPSEVASPAEPDEVENPGQRPEPYVAPDSIVELVEAYEEGVLGDTPRESVVGSRALTVEITVKKQLVGAEIYRVEFMDTSGNLVCTAFADSGTYAEYTGPVQRKEPDASATYEFCGWVDADGRSVDITDVRSNLVLYPSFTATPKKYTVTWNVDGIITEESVQYGELPSYTDIPTKPDFKSFYYVFVGWDKEIREVTEDVTYTAVFEARFIFTSENGTGVIVDNSNGDFIINAQSFYDSTFDLSEVIPRAAESGAVYINSGKYSLSIAYADVMAMNSLGVKKLNVQQILLVGGRYSFGVRLLDEAGNDILPSEGVRAAGTNVKIGLTLPLTVTDPESLVIYCLEGAERKPIRASYKDGRLSLSCMYGVTYYAAEEYAVDIIPCENIDVSVDKTAASVGEAVRISLSQIPKGTVLDSVYYIDCEGNRTEITSGEFTMPRGGASVGVDFHYEKYTVSFIADGRVIFTQTATYGEMPTPPPTPEKASDEQYSYTFVGWTPAISAVTGDVSYTAKYMQTVLPPKPEPSGLQITDGVMRIIVLACVGMFYAVGVGIPVLVIISVKIAVRLRWRKRVKKTKNQRNKLDTGNL